MSLEPCALALTGGVSKGAFHVGVLKAFAEHKVVPSVIVGASAGALNGAFAAKLIAEDQFTPAKIDDYLTDMWLNQASFQKLWSSGEINDQSLRSFMGDTRLNIFLLRRILAWLSPHNVSRLREFFQLKFTSVLSDKHYSETLKKGLVAPLSVKRDIHFSAALTSLVGTIETYANQPLVSYGGYTSFHLHEEMSAREIEDSFAEINEVVKASGSFPILFPPVPLQVNGKKDMFSDGGLTKNAPFGRAIKLNPNVKTIFLVSCMPVTQPTSGPLDNLFTVVDQVYKIIVNKDLANDYRKIQKINEQIVRLQGLLKRDENGRYLRGNEFNQALLDVAGFASLDDFEKKRVVDIVIIEPPINLEGDPFAGMYRSDRVRVLNDYIKIGYTTAKKVLSEYSELDLLV